MTWIEPIRADPGATRPSAVARETIRLAFVAALQHLPPRQRAVLILCEVLRWQATEVAELLETSVASVNSALQRARATLEASGRQRGRPAAPSSTRPTRELLDRYVEAFEAYDIDALTALIHEDATQSMPPFDLWLAGRDDIFTWWFGPGIGCAGLPRDPAGSANGSPAYGQYKPSDGRRLRPVGAAGARGLRRQASPSSPSSSTPRRSSRSSGCRSRSRRSACAETAERARARRALASDAAEPRAPAAQLDAAASRPMERELGAERTAVDLHPQTDLARSGNSSAAKAMSSGAGVGSNL